MDEQKTTASSEKLDFAFRLIKYANNPWKITLLILLIISMIFCYTVWEYRRDITFWIMSGIGAPSLDLRSIDGSATRLMDDVGAIAVNVWSINLNQNRRKSVYFRIGQQRMDTSGSNDLALRPYSEYTANLIKILTEKTLCARLIKNSGIADMAAKKGVTYVCFAALPPSYGDMVGLLAAGFIERPDNEDYIKIRMIQAAEEMTK